MESSFYVIFFPASFVRALQGYYYLISQTMTNSKKKLEKKTKDNMVFMIHHSKLALKGTPVGANQPSPETKFETVKLLASEALII